ncbi:phage holin family protein [Mumia sp. zg.B17]|uniref:phage holin family protein n=1 Tax=unclassified Mumia TaxID=2621872 RepID=UPI001C6F2B0C|nr:MULTISPECIES: phage holin family protein [unclassified Mumia]MBW9204783.1 phage holin family protein [Mumia sp. zg.B17]MBW9209212.1 phage holin family protein [Mumia sp. zg.B21]MDD9348623.1 phage holin family protein [Mumia sp.]
MIRLLINAAIALGSSAVGILVATWALPEMDVEASGFATAVVVFTLAQVILSPFVTTVAARNAPAFLGGIGLVSTLVALIIARVATDGLSISGVTTWVLAALIVWLVTALAAFFLPMIFLKRRRDDRAAGRPR